MRTHLNASPAQWSNHRVSFTIGRQCDFRRTHTHTHTRSVCEGLLLTTCPKLNHNSSHHVLNLEDVPSLTSPFEDIYYLFIEVQDLSCTLTPCRVTTGGEDVLIWCVLLQGQHVRSQYWTGDAR